MYSEENSKVKQANIVVRAGTWIWRFFSSVKLAVILILILVGLSLIGAFLIQVPADTLKDPAAYAAWVDQYGVQKVGAWAPLLKLLQLFQVFSSIWFLGAGTLLMINILVCSFNRWGNIKLVLNGGTIKREDNFLTSGKEDSRAEIADVPAVTSELAKLLETILKKRRYRVRLEQDSENVYIAADKNRWFKSGTYVSHLSLILLVLAFIFGNILGWEISSFKVVEGSNHINNQVGHDTYLSLRLDKFTVSYYDDGTPKDYRSDVTLFENGQEVQQAAIRVNYPLEYKGVMFYQSSYGTALNIKVHNTNLSSDTTTTPDAITIGNLIYDGDITVVPMGMSMGMGMGSGYYVGSFRLPEQNLLVYVIISSNPADPMIPAGSVGIEVINQTDGSDAGLAFIAQNMPTIINNLQFTFTGNRVYSVFQVSKDPTVTIIWIACALFIIGICMVLYFPHRQVWAIAQKTDKGTSRLLIRTIAPRSFGNSAEIKVLTNSIEKHLPPKEFEKE